MQELAEAGVVGYSDDGSPAASSRLMREALEYSRISGLPVIDHCEDTSLADGAQMNEGVISSELGLKGMPAAADIIQHPTAIPGRLPERTIFLRSAPCQYL